MRMDQRGRHLPHQLRHARRREPEFPADQTGDALRQCRRADEARPHRQAVDRQCFDLSFANQNGLPAAQSERLIAHEGFRQRQNLRAIDGDATSGSPARMGHGLFQDGAAVGRQVAHTIVSACSDD